MKTTGKDPRCDCFSYGQLKKQPIAMFERTVYVASSRLSLREFDHIRDGKKVNVYKE